MFTRVGVYTARIVERLAQNRAVTRRPAVPAERDEQRIVRALRKRIASIEVELAGPASHPLVDCLQLTVLTESRQRLQDALAALDARRGA
jgi:hypothetical protein